MICDGFYVVDYKGIYAGFEIKGGRITRCAPVLRKRMDFWMTIGRRMEIPEEIEQGDSDGTMESTARPITY